MGYLAHKYQFGTPNGIVFKLNLKMFVPHKMVTFRIFLTIRILMNRRSDYTPQQGRTPASNRINVDPNYPVFIYASGLHELVSKILRVSICTGPPIDFPRHLFKGSKFN